MSDVPFRVKVDSGSAKGAKFAVKAEAVVIGSGEEADIIIQGPGVEARHAQIVYAGGRVLLEDLGTQAGTSRNGQRLLGQANIFPGDRIGLGPEVVLILEGDDPREGAAEEDLAAGAEGLTPEEPGPA